MLKKSTKVRVNYRLERWIVRWVKRYAKEQKVTATAVVERALKHMEDHSHGRPVG